jgi:hypothetical protein
MNDIIDKLNTITRQLDSIHAELASIRQEVTDTGIHEMPIGYLIDIEPYCDHKAVTDYLCRELPRGVPANRISNIRQVFVKTGIIENCEE